jgi:hypothetical protein
MTVIHVGNNAFHHRFVQSNSFINNPLFFKKYLVFKVKFPHYTSQIYSKYNRSVMEVYFHQNKIRFSSQETAYLIFGWYAVQEPFPVYFCHEANVFANRFCENVIATKDFQGLYMHERALKKLSTKTKV